MASQDQPKTIDLQMAAAERQDDRAADPIHASVSNPLMSVRPAARPTSPLTELSGRVVGSLEREQSMYDFANVQNHKHKEDVKRSVVELRPLLFILQACADTCTAWIGLHVHM